MPESRIMAKRARGVATQIRSFKRRKSVQDTHTEYKIRRILAEDDTRYLIDWADDETTGERFSPSWEPKENANKLATEDWLNRQILTDDNQTSSLDAVAAHNQADKPHRPARVPSTKLPALSVVSSKPSRRLHRRIILDSSQSESHDPVPEEVPESPQREIETLVQVASRDSRTIPVRVSVIIAEPPASYVNGQYRSDADEGEAKPSEQSDSSYKGDRATPVSANNCTRSSVNAADELSKGDATVSSLLSEHYSPLDPAQFDILPYTEAAAPKAPEPKEFSALYKVIRNSNLANLTTLAPPNNSSVTASSTSQELSSLDHHLLPKAVLSSQRDIRAFSQTPSCLLLSTPVPKPAPKVSHQSESLAQGKSTLPVLLERDNRPSATKNLCAAYRAGSFELPISEPQSPSTIPAMEPPPMISQEEICTSGRYETLVPAASDSQDILNDGRSGPVSFQTSGVRKFTHHVIPLPLLGHQRDQYPQTVLFRRGLIQELLTANPVNRELISKAKVLAERIRLVAIHPDLENVETLTQYEVHPSQQAQWDVDCSAKFRFLRELLLATAGRGLRITILTSSNEMQSKATEFLRGVAIAADSRSREFDEAMVCVVNVNNVSTQTMPTTADLVIALDPRISQVTALNKDTFGLESGVEPLCIVLLVVNTIEHIEFSMAPSMEPDTRLKAVLRNTYRLCREAGKLSPPYMSLHDAVRAISAKLLDANTHDIWPIPGPRPLDNLDSQTQSDVGGAVSSVPKRLHEQIFFGEEDDETLEDTVKRARIVTYDVPGSDNITVNPADIEITHISDSMAVSTQPDDRCAEQELRALVQMSQIQLSDHVRELENLQYRCEDQRRLLKEANTARDSAVEDTCVAIARNAEQAATISRQKVEINSLQQKLDGVRTLLLQHESPGRADLEAARDSATAALSERDRLNERLSTVKKDLDYAQAMYQESSNSAQTLAVENTLLREQLSAMEKVANGKHAELRQMGEDSRFALLRRDFVRCRHQLRQTEFILRAREEELARLKELGRGRVITRGISIPRSPRPDSPLRYNQYSRQTSPTVEELKTKFASTGSSYLHSLRNS